MNIIKFQNKHKEEVFNLFEKVFQKKITDDFWQWRYNYFGNPIQQIMKQGNKIVGHYCVHPIPIKRKNDFEDALFSMSVMSHPDYRGNKIFENLANNIYNIAKEKNYKIIFGFPNLKSASIHFKKLGWKNLGKQIEIKKMIDNKFQDSRKYKINQISNFGEIGDNLWKKYKNLYEFIIPRTSNYLKWRFELVPKQKFYNYDLEKYYFFTLEDNGVIIAYFVLKKFGINKIHLVDYFGKLNFGIMKDIINFGLKFTKENNFKEFSMWRNDYLENLELEKLFNENGFTSEESESYFGIKSLDLNTEILERQKWFLTMSDSDVY